MRENSIDLFLGTQSLPKTFAARFWNKVSKTETCWNWTGSKTDDGYGHIGLKHPMILKAHRAAWMIHFGPIPDGMCVLHKCDNPSCVRPDHLFLGTRVDNVQDMDNKHRRGTTLGKHYTIGEAHRSAKLTTALIKEIRSIPSTVSSWKLAKKFGVSHSAIQDVRNFVTWRFVT